MKEILMMIQRSCPHCREALRIMEDLKKAYPEYENIPLRIIDEREEKAFADSLDYWYVPTCFVDGKKIHEGVPDVQSIQAVCEYALAQ